MKTGKLTAALAAGGLLCGMALTIAPAQALPPAGTVYSLHSGPDGSCPGMDWHVVTGPDGTLQGMISWNGMKSMAHVEGKLDSSGKFAMDAKEVGGAGRTATITGNAQNDGWLLASVAGPGIECKDIKIPIWRTSGTKQ